MSQLEARPEPAGSAVTEQKVRLVTATSLFDGHDASINIFRRIAQGAGAEVIHLGHNRSAAEIVEAAIAEDAHGIAVTSYQGGHNEFFRYMHDLLAERVFATPALVPASPWLFGDALPRPEFQWTESDGMLRLRFAGREAPARWLVEWRRGEGLLARGRRQTGCGRHRPRWCWHCVSR